MKFLFLTIHYPSPPDYGAAKRVYHLCRLLEDIGEVTLAVLRGPDWGDQNRLLMTKHDFRSVKALIADRQPPIGFLGKRDRLFRNRKVGSRCLSLSIENRDKLIELIKNSDVVWCHTLRAADMGNIYDYGRSVIDLDDLNSEKLAFLSCIEKGFSKWRIYCSSILWRRWEKDSLRRFSAVAVCSEQDRIKIGCLDKVFVLPNGFEMPKRPFEFKISPNKVIGFVGVLDYLPNAEAVRWFTKEIFPMIKLSEPEIRFRVAGKLPAGGIGIEDEQADILGYVEDLDAEIRNWDAMVVPLKAGGGTRLKILEAFSKRIPVISTRLGAYGIAAEHGKHLLMADDPSHFAEHCLKVIRDRIFAEQLTINAFELFRNNYTWDHIGVKVRAIQRFLESA